MQEYFLFAGGYAVKIKDSFYLKNISGENIVFCSDKSENFNKVIKLTNSAAFLWRELKSGEKTNEELFNSLVDFYNISSVLALNEIDTFLRTLRENGILEK